MVRIFYQRQIYIFLDLRLETLDLRLLGSQLSIADCHEFTKIANP